MLSVQDKRMQCYRCYRSPPEHHYPVHCILHSVRAYVLLFCRQGGKNDEVAPAEIAPIVVEKGE